MGINPLSQDCVELNNKIDTLILELYRGLTRGNPSDADKDAALTWWNRGQIVALEKIKNIITIKEE